MNFHLQPGLPLFSPNQVSLPTARPWSNIATSQISRSTTSISMPQPRCLLLPLGSPGTTYLCPCPLTPCPSPQGFRLTPPCSCSSPGLICSCLGQSPGGMPTSLSHDSGLTSWCCIRGAEQQGLPPCTLTSTHYSLLHSTLHSKSCLT